VISIFDAEVIEVNADMYRAAVAPELYPAERPFRTENWHPEDQVAYCGGAYAKAAYTN
jgi:hypothetical protein